MREPNSGSFKPGNVANPSGRPKKTDEERAGETYLRERTVDAARTLFELQGPEHEPRIRLGAVQTHLKITLGELERKAGADGVTADSPYVGLTHEQLAAIALHQLEKMEAAALKPPDDK